MRGIDPACQNENGYAIAEALIALTIIALMTGLVFQSMSQLGGMTAKTGERRHAYLLARSIMASTTVASQVAPMPPSGVDNGLAWRVTYAPFRSELGSGLALEQVSVMVADEETGRPLALLDSLKVKQ